MKKILNGILRPPSVTHVTKLLWSLRYPFEITMIPLTKYFDKALLALHNW